MTEFKGTPAPWRAVNDPCHFDSVSTIKSEDGKIIAQFCADDVFKLEADTRLAAAAPDLLLALQAIYSTIECSFPSLINTEPMNRAQSAIKKALGE